MEKKNVMEYNDTAIVPTAREICNVIKCKFVKSLDALVLKFNRLIDEALCDAKPMSKIRFIEEINRLQKHITAKEYIDLCTDLLLNYFPAPYAATIDLAGLRTAFTRAMTSIVYRYNRIVENPQYGISITISIHDHFKIMDFKIHIRDMANLLNTLSYIQHVRGDNRMSVIAYLCKEVKKHTGTIIPYDGTDDDNVIQTIIDVISCHWIALFDMVCRNGVVYLCDGSYIEGVC